MAQLTSGKLKYTPMCFPNGTSCYYLQALIKNVHYSASLECIQGVLRLCRTKVRRDSVALHPSYKMLIPKLVSVLGWLGTQWNITYSPYTRVGHFYRGSERIAQPSIDFKLKTRTHKKIHSKMVPASRYLGFQNVLIYNDKKVGRASSSYETQWRIPHQHHSTF